jgi:hypothetical protein
MRGCSEQGSENMRPLDLKFVPELVLSAALLLPDWRQRQEDSAVG